MSLEAIPDVAMTLGRLVPAKVDASEGGALWIGTDPYTAMADGARVLSLDLADAGLDPSATYLAREFWSGEVLDDVAGVLSVTVEPHTVSLFALRERLGRPQYIGGNRHLLQGAVEVGEIARAMIAWKRTPIRSRRVSRPEGRGWGVLIQLRRGYEGDHGLVEVGLGGLVGISRGYRTRSDGRCRR